MVLDLGALDAKELVLVAVAIAGLVPVLTQRTDGSRLFTVGYVLLCFGAVATNAEHLLLGEVLGLLEHVVGIGAAGVVFLVAARSRRRRIVDGEEIGSNDLDSDAVDGGQPPIDAVGADGGEAA
ncbi:hypothetical protein [Halobaculum magnesiiphilum]|uniref:hypothetical protein n=1 Tax=Halobaculum magnesiiphilum TaxID=1017351 RepID=UPI001CED5381|nr:hypothetical protein [Halobaculum magnesiiphilum]